jgi:hypothetical protein
MRSGFDTVKAKKWYLTFALVVTNTTVALAVVNALLYAAMLATTAWRDRHPLLAKFGLSRVGKAYPGLSQEDVIALMRENNTLSLYEPFTGFKPEAVAGRFFRISEQGFRHVAAQGPWPPGDDALNIFVFGGSTTMGAGVPDGQTIPSYLQEQLSGASCGLDVRVYNFGRPQYFSSQERVLFESLLLEGRVPNVAVFIDGLNDFYHWNGEPEWTDRMRLLVARSNQPASPALAIANLMADLPLGRLARRLSSWGRGDGTATAAGEAEPSFDDERVLRAVIDRWVRNKRLIEAVARAFEVRAAFVWQPIPVYKYDLRYHLFYDGDLSTFRSHQRSRYGYALMEELRPALGLGENFLYLADLSTGRRENLYVDSVHYTARFAEEISSRIAHFLGSSGLLRCQRSAAIE